MYVDDPLIVVSGTFRQRMRMLVKTAVALTCLGFDMASNKMDLADVGQAIAWTSANFKVRRGGVDVEDKPSIAQDNAADVEKFLAINVIPVEDLRTLCGRLVCAASLLFSLETFLWTCSGHRFAKGSREGTLLLVACGQLR